MRSARILLATAATSAALTFATPGSAFAAPAEGHGGHDDSSYSKEYDSGSGQDYDKSSSDHDKSYNKDYGKDGNHDGPRGGMRTGGGALAAVQGGDEWSSSHGDSEHEDSYKDKEEESYKSKDSGHGKDSWGGGDDHDKPRGGMHTGGGGLASPGVTTGGLAILAVGATGMYALRRKKAIEQGS
ncbi:hypothetical protein ACWCPM_17905 [Streptomyces sp. NPDC002309]